ncbi:contractile injection system tape measure protein [Herbaspirillum rhizosphaerae]|uniref:contractile injection system tape measure protein n=1 Tax=Herbaspirillum rhizosphaerae TaxID=346179 RepID=UPI00067C0FB6|nr:contractile injection system tape measure protein [Herbaspirillum rhizosphaerae]
MTATHRIGELVFDLAFESPTIGIARTEELRSMVVDKLLPLMETVFDQFGGDDVVWQIDNLVVDVGDVTEADLPATLVDRLRTALEQALHGEDEPAAGSDAPVGRINRRRGDVDVLLAFLADGTMAWQVDAAAPASHATALARVLARDADAFLQALAASPYRTVMLTRLARQFAPAQLEMLLRRMRPGHADAVLSQLAALQELLQEAALTRTVWSGALHAAWEAALTAALDGTEEAAQAPASTLTGRALRWLAERQREDLAIVASRLLAANSSRHGRDASDNDVVHALRRISSANFPAEGVEGSAFSMAKGAIGTVRGETPGQAAAMPAAPGRPTAAALHATDDWPEEWRVLAADPGDQALLTRLVRQSSPAVLQTILRHVTPDHVKPLLAQLEALQRVLAGLSVSDRTSQEALSAAWAYILGAVLARPIQLPALLPMLETVIAVLAAEQTSAPAAPVLTRIREAAAALGDPAGLATALMVMEGMRGERDVLPSAVAAPSSAIDIAPDVDSHAPPSAMAAMRSRVTSALMSGNAGDIYDDWRAFQEHQPDLLRSAVLHYGGYGEIREKMASTFPLSLLRDMEALLSHEAAALTARIWDDEGLRSRLNVDGAARWNHWRRGWWRGAVAYLFRLAREQANMAGSAVAASFDASAYVAAALGGAGITAADQDLYAYVMALVHDRAPQRQRALMPRAEEPPKKEPQLQTPPAVSPMPSLTALFDAIRSGAGLLQMPAFDVDQLALWVHEAVREPSFRQAIDDHAALARDRRAYYAHVLQALAQNRIVDLEEFAAAEDLALPLPASQEIPVDVSAALIDTVAQAIPDYPPGTETATTAATAPGNTDIDEERGKAQLVGRLAKALMKGDPAPLYGDWDILLHKHAPLLREALRHYGIRDDILERIVWSFPESMLYDMAVLLAPEALSAWRQLRDQSTWAAALEMVSDVAQTLPAPDGDASSVAEDQDDLILPTPEMLAGWKRQLWKAALQQRLLSDQRGEERRDGEKIAGDNGSAVGSSSLTESILAMDGGSIHALASSLSAHAGLVRSPWQRRMLATWAGLSGRSELARQNDARELLATESETVRGHREDDIRAILDYQHRLTATEKPAATARDDVLQRFARLKDDPVAIDASWAADDLERLVEAYIVVHGADDANDAGQQRRIFLQAIRAQARSVSGPDRTRYFNAVLQALLHDQMLDLEEIAEASKNNRERIAADKAEDKQPRSKEKYDAPELQESATNTADQRDSESLAHVDFMLSPDFRTGIALPAGLADWLRMAIDATAQAVVPMLATLSRHPDAVARLLAVVPASSWQKLPALAPYSPLQVQRMRRYAGDVADIFAEQNRQLSATEMARFEWRFLLPYLFAPDRIFEPARFTSELVGFLSRESGLPITHALTSHLRSQMGIAVALPRAAAGPIARAETGGASDKDIRATTTAASLAGARGSSNEDAKTSNDRTLQTAPAGDQAAPQMSSGMHVANAGMVLTWPFLSRAWEVLELTRDGKFVDEVAAQRAAWLLEFAVNEQTAVPEYQLTLNKLLCGIPLQAPIVAEIEVTPQERELVEQLLTVMISHWSAIGNTSIQGLRETFLQREGYLSRKEDAWRLQVPKRTFDMLLDKLPWSISTIRLPWMETILWVEWT